MHHTGRREDAILFAGCLFSSVDNFNAARHELIKKFGKVLFVSPQVPWNYSGYYDRELKPPIFRSFLFFEAIVDPPCLVDAKLAVMEIEKKLSANNRRLINLDPGYLTLAKTVLASRKNYSHRINLGKGVFAELELFFMHGRFNPMPYTYSDYKDLGTIHFFTVARELLKKSLEARLKKV
jgi:hypothetical protein